MLGQNDEPDDIVIEDEDIPADTPDTDAADDNVTEADIGEISRLLLNNDDIELSGDIDEYMANKLVEFVQKGRLTEDAARAFAKKQRFVENGYMADYDNIASPDNIITKKTSLDYHIGIIKKDMELLQNGTLNTSMISQSNRLSTDSMISSAAVRSYARKSRQAENSFADALDYGKELFTRILSSIPYNIQGEKITELEAFSGILRANKRLVSLDAILGQDKLAPKLKLSDIFDTDILTAKLPDLASLLIDRDILDTLILRSADKNPVNDIFSKSRIQTISVMNLNGSVYTFNCADTSAEQRNHWLNLRKQMIGRHKLHLTAAAGSISKWSTQFCTEALMADAYADVSLPGAESFRNKIHAEQGNVFDKLRSRAGRITKSAVTKSAERKAEKTAAKQDASQRQAAADAQSAQAQQGGYPQNMQGMNAQPVNNMQNIQGMNAQSVSSMQNMYNMNNMQQNMNMNSMNTVQQSVSTQGMTQSADNSRKARKEQKKQLKQQKKQQKKNRQNRG